PPSSLPDALPIFWFHPPPNFGSWVGSRTLGSSAQLKRLAANGDSCVSSLCSCGDCQSAYALHTSYSRWDIGDSNRSCTIGHICKSDGLGVSVGGNRITAIFGLRLKGRDEFFESCASRDRLGIRGNATKVRVELDGLLALGSGGYPCAESDACCVSLRIKALNHQLASVFGASTNTGLVLA